MTLKIFLAIFILTTLNSCNSDTTKHMTSKKFKESYNTAVFTTKFVTTDKKDITKVTHEKEDGAWQFFSNDHFDNFEDVAKIVGLGEIIKMDSSILELADMKDGYVAHRNSKSDKWIIEESKQP
jgi:hypothetical protein